MLQGTVNGSIAPPYLSERHKKLDQFARKLFESQGVINGACCIEVMER